MCRSRALHAHIVLWMDDDLTHELNLGPSLEGVTYGWLNSSATPFGSDGSTHLQHLLEVSALNIR